MGTEEEVYMAKSLDFINSYKKNFLPLLSNIASDLNDEKNKDLIGAMNIMKNRPNPKLKDSSTLKELITKLSEKKLIKGDYILTDHHGDFAKYVEQCLRIILIERSKKSMYNLFYLLMQDLKSSENKTLMKAVNIFKEKNKDWKKMVGMLIPPDAQVKILVDLVEPSTRSLIFGNNNKWRPLTSREVIGTVVKRGAMIADDTIYAKQSIYTRTFKKVVRLPKNIIEEANVDEEVRLDPEHIELYDSQPEALGASAAAEASTAAVPVDDESEEASGSGLESGTPSQQQQPAVTSGTAQKPPTTTTTIPVEKPEQQQQQPEQPQQQGGQQRTTRKHKNSIIGSARKTRTNR
jgi:hypothetical protein